MARLRGSDRIERRKRNVVNRTVTLAGYLQEVRACACGCGRSFRPWSATAFYATEECILAAHRRRERVRRRMIVDVESAANDDGRGEQGPNLS